MQVRSLLFILITCTVAVCFSCNSEKRTGGTAKKLPGNWQAIPVVADGKKTEWPSPYPYNNDKAMISYDISNDKDNLYITIQSGDAATELKLLRKGIVVWIDKTGGEQEITSICFPSDNDKGPKRQERGNVDGQNNSSQNNRDLMQAVDKALSTANGFYLQGFKNCRGKYNITDGDTCGIKVGVGLDEYDQLVWEAVIPFKTFYNKAIIDKRDMGKPISGCFDILGLDRPAGQGGGQRGSGGSGMHMGMGGFGMGGMGIGGGRRSGNSNNANEQLYKSITFWQKVGIAYME
jgi:hypothetical protein